MPEPDGCQQISGESPLLLLFMFSIERDSAYASVRLCSVHKLGARFNFSFSRACCADLFVCELSDSRLRYFSHLTRTAFVLQPWIALLLI